MRTRSGDGGQAAVELALVLPVVALMVLLVVQVGLVVRDDLLVVNAAREAARAAAVDPTVAVARDAAIRTAGLAGDRLSVELTRSDGEPGLVHATVTYRDETTVPLVGPLLPPVTLRSTVTMAVEEPLG